MVVHANDYSLLQLQLHVVDSRGWIEVVRYYVYIHVIIFLRDQSD